MPMSSCSFASINRTRRRDGRIQTPFSLHDPVELGDLVADSGFKEISVVRKTHEERFSSIKNFISTLHLSSDIAELSGQII